MSKDLLQAYIFPAVQLPCSLNVSFRTACLPPVLCDMAGLRFLCLFLETGLCFPESIHSLREKVKGISIACQEILHLLKTRVPGGTARFEE